MDDMNCNVRDGITTSVLMEVSIRLPLCRVTRRPSPVPLASASCSYFGDVVEAAQPLVGGSASCSIKRFYPCLVGVEAPSESFCNADLLRQLLRWVHHDMSAAEAYIAWVDGAGTVVFTKCTAIGID